MSLCLSGEADSHKKITKAWLKFFLTELNCQHANMYKRPVLGPQNRNLYSKSLHTCHF